MRKIVAAFFLGLTAACTPPSPGLTLGTAAIPVSHERLWLAPLVSETGLEDLDGWPKSPAQQKILLRNFTRLWRNLHSEFRRSEKLGLYTVVNDADHPTVRISIALLHYEFSSDTLRMPVRLQVERINDTQRQIYTIAAQAYAPPKFKTTDPSHYIGILLSDYRRNFPYESIVSFFYPRQEKDAEFGRNTQSLW